MTALFHTFCRALCGGLLFTSVMASVYAAQLPFNQFVVFGDSVADTGTISSGGPPYYTASAFTDGPDTTPATQIQGVWHQQLAQDLGITPATASKAGGSNFAYYPAVSNGADPTYLSLQAQVNQYLSRGAANASLLYLFWGGANDITNLAPSTNVRRYQSAAQNAVQNIENQIAQLYNSGGRNFLWINLPSFDKVPSGLTPPPAIQAGPTAGSQTFDTDWTAAVAQLKQQFPQITITSVDAYSLFNSMTANPSRHGFTNVTQNAYSPYASGNQAVNPDQFLIWYQDHMTTDDDAIIAGTAAQDVDQTYANFGGSDAPEPKSLALLGGSIALLGLLRLRKAR